MESLFSTIAQISFTLLGLFIVALTIDVKSRKFWFGEAHRRRYASIILLYTILPGLVALGGLIPLLHEGVPSWLLLSIFLFAMYVSRYLALWKIVKSPEFHDVLVYETKLETINTARTSLILLTLLILSGSISLYQDNNLITNFLLGFFLFAFTAVSFMPITIILGISFEIKPKTEVIAYVESKTKKKLKPSESNPLKKRNKKSKTK